MACMNSICPFNFGFKCSNDLFDCIVRNLYNTQKQTYAHHTYTTKTR
jgi:hypothetical protein